MTKTLLAAVLALITLAPDAFADVRVRGYYRKDGTYVRPHYRSNPDGSFSNNWSTKGNVNPYTGKPGTLTRPPIRSGSTRTYRGSSLTRRNSSGVSYSPSRSGTRSDVITLPPRTLGSTGSSGQDEGAAREWRAAREYRQLSDEAKAEAKLRLAKQMLELPNYVLAEKWLDAVISEYPGTHAAAEATELLDENADVIAIAHRLAVRR